MNPDCTLMWSVNRKASAVALLREHGIPFEEKYPVNLGYLV